jgi:hypothetical protein
LSGTVDSDGLAIPLTDAIWNQPPAEIGVRFRGVVASTHTTCHELCFIVHEYSCGDLSERAEDEKGREHE